MGTDIGAERSENQTIQAHDNNVDKSLERTNSGQPTDEALERLQKAVNKEPDPDLFNRPKPMSIDPIKYEKESISYNPLNSLIRRMTGNKEKVDLLQNVLKEKKIKSIPLKVSAPFHCSLMKPAADSMREKIINTKFNKPSFQILNNVTAKSETNPDILKKLLIEQIFSTVKWRESLIKMSESGVKTFIEIGPGKALTGMVKRTLKDVNCFSINSIADIKNFTNGFKK